MHYRYHGLTSMVLFTIAVFIAMAAIARYSWPAVAGFVAVNIVSTLGIAFFYCARCTCRRHHCSHVLIGKVADWLPARRQAPYAVTDYLGMFLSAGIVFLYPLPWLWRQPAYLAAFLLIGLLATTEILLAVCPSCRNTNCPVARWKTRERAETAADEEKLA